MDGGRDLACHRESTRWVAAAAGGYCDPVSSPSFRVVMPDGYALCAILRTAGGRRPSLLWPVSPSSMSCLFTLDCQCVNRGEGMLLASKAAWAGIVLILLTTGISEPRRTPLASGANVSKGVPRARLAGAVVVFRFSPAPVAKTTHHQRDRRCFVEVCRRTRPMVCFVNVEKCGRYHLLHLPEIQSGLENQHPLRIYTSRLTARQSIEQRAQLQ